LGPIESYSQTGKTNMAIAMYCEEFNGRLLRKDSLLIKAHPDPVTEKDIHCEWTDTSLFSDFFLTFVNLKWNNSAFYSRLFLVSRAKNEIADIIDIRSFNNICSGLKDSLTLFDKSLLYLMLQKNIGESSRVILDTGFTYNKYTLYKNSFFLAIANKFNSFIYFDSTGILRALHKVKRRHFYQFVYNYGNDLFYQYDFSCVNNDIKHVKRTTRQLKNAILVFSD
jgi:hypothetical protein